MLPKLGKVVADKFSRGFFPPSFTPPPSFYPDAPMDPLDAVFGQEAPAITTNAAEVELYTSETLVSSSSPAGRSERAWERVERDSRYLLDVTGRDEDARYEAYYYALEKETAKHRIVSLKPKRGRQRELLVGWMAEFMEGCLHYVPEAMFAATRYVDLILDEYHVSTKDLQLLGLAAALLAGKMYGFPVEDAEAAVSAAVEGGTQHAAEARRSRLLRLIEFANHYTPEELVTMESYVVDMLHWNMMVLTPVQFLAYYATFCVDEREDHMRGCALDADLVASTSGKVYRMATKFLVQFCLVKNIYLESCPSGLAASSLWVSRKYLGLNPLWPPRYVSAIGYSEDQIVPTASCLELDVASVYGPCQPTSFPTPATLEAAIR